MSFSYERDKIRRIVKRSSIKNYFTPLLPKHSAKPKLSKYSKLLLKNQEPKLPCLNSPVSILNYKTLSNKSPAEKFPNNHLERRLSQVPSNDTMTSHLRKSSDLPSIDVYNNTPDVFKSISPMERGLIPFSLPSQDENLSLKTKKNDRLLNISQMKFFNKDSSFSKSKPKKVITIPKFVSTGENTDDYDFKSWDLEGDSYFL